LTQAVAANQTPDERPDNLLNVILTSPNGESILKLMGLTPAEAATKAEDIKAVRDSKAALAKEGGIGDKSPADEDKVAQLPVMAKNLGLTPAQTAVVISKPNANKPMTNKQYDQTVDKMQAQADTNQRLAYEKERADLQAGDPGQMETTANRIILTNDPSSLDMYYTSRANVKEKVENQLYKTAVAAGVDPSGFTGAALKAKAQTNLDFSGNKRGSTGAQIGSFNAYLGHTAGAVDAEKRLEGKTLGLTNTPLVNTAMDVIGKQFANDPDWKAYQTALVPVETEISNFLAAGYAVKAEDATIMKQVLDPHETPARVTAALKQLAETADVRLAAMGRNYLTTMGTTYPNLVSPESAATLRRLGIQSKAADVGGRLPDGWVNGTLNPQNMTDPKMALQYAKAAGFDRDATQRLARNHGWILQ